MSSPRKDVKKSKLAEQKAKLESFIKEINESPNNAAIVKKIGGDIEQLTTMIEKSNPETLTENEVLLLISKVESFISYNSTLLYFQLDNSIYAELFEIRQPLFATENINITAGCHMIDVGVGEYALADSNSNTLLYTFGAGPCVIVALYNEKTKKSALIHFHTLEQCQALDPILKLLGDTQYTRADLTGGELLDVEYGPPNITLPSNLYRALIAKKVTVRNTDLVHGKKRVFWGGECSRLVLNSSNGGISDNVEDFILYNSSFIYDKAKKINEVIFHQVCNLIQETEISIGDENFILICEKVLQYKLSYNDFLILLKLGLQFRKDSAKNLLQLVDDHFRKDSAKNLLQLVDDHYADLHLLKDKANDFLSKEHQLKFPERPLDSITHDFQTKSNDVEFPIDQADESKFQPITLPKKMLPQVSIFSVNQAEDSKPKETLKKSNFCVLL